MAYIFDLLSSHITINVFNKKLDILKKEYMSDILLEYIQYFINNGGINHFCFDDTISISSNAVLLKTISEVFIDTKNEKDLELNLRKSIHKIANVLKNSTKAFDNLMHGGNDEKQTIQIYSQMPLTNEYIGEINDNHSADICVFTMPIGMYYCSKKDLEKLIDMSFSLSKLAHNNIFGILAGFTSAYFVSLAIQEIAIEKWIFMLIDLLESNTIKKRLDLDNNKIMIDYLEYIRNWRKYVDKRFKEGKISLSNSDQNFIYKLKFHWDFYIDNHIDNSITALITTYDTLLGSESNLEKIIFEALFIPINTICIGNLVGGLYGLMYDYNTIPKNLIDIITKRHLYDSTI